MVGGSAVVVGLMFASGVVKFPTEKYNKYKKYFSNRFDEVSTGYRVFTVTIWKIITNVSMVYGYIMAVMFFYKTTDYSSSKMKWKALLKFLTLFSLILKLVCQKTDTNNKSDSKSDNKITKKQKRCKKLEKILKYPKTVDFLYNFYGLLDNTFTSLSNFSDAGVGTFENKFGKNKNIALCGINYKKTQDDADAIRDKLGIPIPNRKRFYFV